MMQGYVELSPSGAGIHIWIRCREVINRRTKGIEIYSSQRWMTITGRADPAAPRVIPERTDELIQLVEQYFPYTPARLVSPRESPDDDQELWNRLFSGKNGSFVQALYRGDLSVVGGDHSRGVIMLANLLAVFTKGDESRSQQNASPNRNGQ
jgi:primase-polymerase (primpol)-like protein